MALELLSTVADEEGTIVIVATFTDTPISITWKLTDDRGNVINSRTAESETPASSVNIVLSGDDLALPDKNDTTRVVTVWGTFNSLTYGSGLSYSDEVSFTIENYINIT